MSEPAFNLIEPPRLIQHFLDHPPAGFKTGMLAPGIPAFSTRFDLLTTLDPAHRRKVQSLPFYRHWRKILQPYTIFIGTTCSEYAPLPAADPDNFLAALKETAYPEHQFIIVKDLATESVLIGENAFQHNQQIVEAASRHDYFLVEGQALAYVPIDFSDTDEFLARLSASRRKEARRKLKARQHLDIEAVPAGDARFFDESILQAYYGLYLAVFRQSEIHFDLLTPDFFRAVLQDEECQGIVFNYRAGGELIGFNLCFAHQGKLLDKYVGFRYPQAKQHNLYTVSWFHNLSYALEHGLTHYVAGWTDPEIKRRLGAAFTFTRHAVHVRNPALRALLKPFRPFFETDATWHRQHTA